MLLYSKGGAMPVGLRARATEQASCSDHVTVADLVAYPREYGIQRNKACIPPTKF